jgi:glycine cleavage system regulatory protein
MKIPFVITLIGADRPGLVRAIAQEVAAADGDWLESRLAALAGKFAGVVQVAVPEANGPALTARLKTLEAQGLRISIEAGSRSSSGAAPAERVLQLDLIGQDHPGIVRDVARLLAEHQVTVDELETGTSSGPFSGETLFKAHARLRLPPQLSTAELRSLLEALANELMVDVSVLEGDEAQV